MRLRPVRSLAVCVLFIAACASPGGILPKLDTLTAQGRFDEAAALVEGAKLKNYGEKNALLYYLDRGMLLHLAGKWAESNAAFEEAKRLHTELFTKSVTNQAGTFLVSDNIRPYAGEDFERAQVNVFAAVNYLMMGNASAALVEARQVDFFLGKLRTDLGHKNVYTEDAFARYLMGLIYEDEGEINSAYISFYKALEAYDGYAKNYAVAAPPDLVRDALRTARALGFSDEAEAIMKRWGGPDMKEPAPRLKGAGEVVVLHYQGLPPRKVDSFFEVSVGSGWAYVNAQKPVGEDARQAERAKSILRSVAANKMVRVAFPAFEQTPYGVKGLTVRADGVEQGRDAALAQDIGAIAEKNLKDRVLREKAKAVARALIKWALTQKVAAKVEEKQGQGVAWLVKAAMQAASTATELADKRSWATLPDRIAVARMALPAGAHALNLAFRTAAGAEAGRKDLQNVEVRPGKRTYVLVRTAN